MGQDWEVPGEWEEEHILLLPKRLNMVKRLCQRSKKQKRATDVNMNSQPILAINIQVVVQV